MKKPVEIVLRTVHIGAARRVVTLGLDGRDLARDFLLELLQHDRNQFEFVRKRIQSISNHDRYENQITFRHLGDGVFEFKRPGIRLYAFYDGIGDQEQLILCTNGGLKGKAQSRDLQLARRLKDEYFRAKALPDTILRLIEP